MSDWLIVLEPRSPDVEGGNLAVLSGGKDEARETLDLYAMIITRNGYVPDGLDWRNRTGAVVTGHPGQLRYNVRLDCWETETSDGHGFLVAREQPS